MGRKAKRCEPCNHDKKQCAECKKMICLNDFTLRQDAGIVRRRNYCKDCQNKIWVYNRKGIYRGKYTVFDSKLEKIIERRIFLRMEISRTYKELRKYMSDYEIFTLKRPANKKCAKLLKYKLDCKREYKQIVARMSKINSSTLSSKIIRIKKAKGIPIETYTKP